MTKCSLNVLDLFSGIGGFSLGLENSGCKTIAFAENNPYCQRVLAKHWPTIPCFGDVKEINAKHFPYSWPGVVCGGFPCQDISLAGAGAGLGGERSGLWFEFLRIIGEFRPRYAIIENVSALRSRGLEVVLGGLASIGYDAEWHCIPAAAVGAPHRRDRIWIVAYPNGDDGRSWGQGRLDPGGAGQPEPERALRHTDGSGLAIGESLGSYPRPKLQAIVRTDRWASQSRMGGASDELPCWLDRHIGRGMSYAASARATEALRGVWSAHVARSLRRCIGGFDRVQQAEVLFAFVRQYQDGADETRLLVEGAEASEDFLRSLRRSAATGSAPLRPGYHEQLAAEYPDALQPLSPLLAHDGETDWAGDSWEDAVPRVAPGVPARVDRLRALGNSIVPEIAYQIGRAIMEAEYATP